MRFDDVCDGPRHRARDRGAAAVEYALIVALVAIISVPVISALGGGLNEGFTDVVVAIEADPCSAYATEWPTHLAFRSDRLEAGTWKGRSNRDMRIDWRVRRNELRTVRSENSC